MTMDGGFQDYVVVDSRQVVPIPDPLTPRETAPLMCAGWTIYSATRKAENEVRCSRIGKSRGEERDLSSMSIGISGAGGGLGHLGLQFAVKLGWGKVVAIDAAAGSLQTINDVLRDLPSTDASRVSIIDIRAEPSPHEARTRIFGRPAANNPLRAGELGLDAVIILPESQAAFSYGVSLLRNHGTCVVISFPEHGFTVPSYDLVFRHLRVVGSLAGSRQSLVDMMELAAKEGVRSRSRYFPLEELNELVGVFHEGKSGGKLVVDMEMEH